MFEAPNVQSGQEFHAAHAPVASYVEVIPAGQALPTVNRLVSASRGYAGFELPRRVWLGMLTSYGLFFVAIVGATGGSGRAIFAIVVSILYTVMFFGLARTVARQAGPEAISPLDRGQPLQTWTGPMQASAVYGQVLVVPMAIASFGVAIAVITAVIL